MSGGGELDENSGGLAVTGEKVETDVGARLRLPCRPSNSGKTSSQ